MRHPIDRAWSFVQMEVAKAFATVPPDIISGDPQGEHLAFVREKLFQPEWLARSDYATTIRRWRDLFGDEALMLFRYERIASEPRALLADICRHIGVDPAWASELTQDVIRRTVFPSEKIPFPPALRNEFAEHCAPYIADLELLLGERFDDWRS